MREISDTEFEQVVAAGKVVVDFFATWCPPCRALLPTLERVAKDFSDVTIVKINVDEQMTNASRYNVSSLPTLIFFQDGEELKRKVGAMPEPDLRSWLRV